MFFSCQYKRLVWNVSVFIYMQNSYHMNEVLQEKDIVLYMIYHIIKLYRHFYNIITVKNQEV